MTKIIQLITPLERFQAFDKDLDKALNLLDKCAEQYIFLPFREKDVEDYTREQALALKEELVQHAQLVMSALNHPLLQVIGEKRNIAQENDPFTSTLGYPTGIWQHHKGTKYEILGPCRLTDSRLDGVSYRLANNPEGQIYAISLVNFYRLIEKNGSKIKRFVKVE